MFEEDDAFEDHPNHRNSPLFLKASEILSLAHRIAEMAARYEPDSRETSDKEILLGQAIFIREEASRIPNKIRAAESVDLYDLQMENAVIIRKSARDLLTHLAGLEIHGFREKEYLDLLRKEIEEFRILFAEWVKTFDPWNYLIDRWGLFNPPGINYDDPDLPFDEED